MDQFIKAIMRDDIVEVQILLSQDCDLVNSYQDGAKVTPLHFAAQNNACECALALIKAGANINAQTEDGLTPLDVARLHEHDDIIQLFMEYES